MGNHRASVEEIWSAVERLHDGESIADIAVDIDFATGTVRKWFGQYGHLESIAELKLLLKPNDTRYVRMMRQLFDQKWVNGTDGFDWTRDELPPIARMLGFEVPKNLGDNIYSIRYGREDLPQEILDLAPAGRTWLLLPNGKGKYRFILTDRAFLEIDAELTPVQIPDSTPQIVARHAKNDEQAVLARIRYCRLIDIFMGIASFQLQSHMRTTINRFNKSQTELDEVYVGVDKAGTQFVVPIQAKSPTERIGVIQIITDKLVCEEKFPSMTPRTVAAKIVNVEETADLGRIYTIALIEAEVTEDFNVSVLNEIHFRLLPASAF